ncbi:MAG: cohesin domain-containing protein, partial [Burkholderiales bacterium]
VQQGETIEGGYRVESIGEEQITLTYLPLGKKETIPVFSLLPAAARANVGSQAQTLPAQAASRAMPGAAASNPAAGAAPIAPANTDAVAAASAARENKPAQLLWEGPQQVRLGSRFDVALKVTSGEPLRATPMQLRFDPAFLEFVAAKPGKSFGGGAPNFSYRANADGSIFVGNSSQNPVPVSDAELLVLTFRPLKPAAAAELGFASLSLQGPAGRPIAFGQPEAFKTAISP